MAAGLGSTPGIIVGVGVGAAASAALTPAIELPKQKAWADNPNRILDPQLLARLVAQGGVALGAAYTEAARDGFAPDKVDALVYLAQTVPGVNEAVTLWRRGLIDDGLFSHVLAKAALDNRYAAPLRESKLSEPLSLGQVGTAVVQQIENPDGAHVRGSHLGFTPENVDVAIELARSAPATAEVLAMRDRDEITDDEARKAFRKHGIPDEWHDNLLSLRMQRIDPAVIALAIVRGIMDDPGFLPVGPPSGSGKVPPFPKSSLDSLKEAAAHGWDFDRLFVQTAISGRPMAPELAAHAVFRQIIEKVDFQRAVSEGDFRNEWAESLFEVTKAILTPGQYAELQLRGFLTATERRAKTDQYGMSAEDSDLLYDVTGRSIPVHAITTGLARGGSFGGTGSGIPDAYLESLERGNLRPEYFDLAYANRYTYPSLFALRALFQAGVFDQAEANQLLLELGWKPDLAEKVSTFYAKPTGAAADPHVVKAQGQLWTATHKAYVKAGLDRSSAEGNLSLLDVSADAQAAIFSLWDAEIATTRQTLTAPQIKRAFVVEEITEQEAVARLERLGYSQADAELYLHE